MKYIATVGSYRLFVDPLVSQLQHFVRAMGTQSDRWTRELAAYPDEVDLTAVYDVQEAQTVGSIMFARAYDTARADAGMLFEPTRLRFAGPFSDQAIVFHRNPVRLAYEGALFQFPHDYDKRLQMVKEMVEDVVDIIASTAQERG